MTYGGPKQKYEEQDRQEDLVRKRNQLADIHPGEWGDKRSEAVNVDTAVVVGWLRKAADEMRAADQNGWPVTCDAAADTLEQEHAARVKAEEALRPFASRTRLSEYRLDEAMRAARALLPPEQKAGS